MSLNETYDDQNVFAKIIRGEIPSAKIYEDKKVLAFMDAFPQSRGHSLVISKTAQSVNLLDLPEKALRDVMEVTQKVTRASRKALNPDGIRIMQFNGSPAGQTVYHTHFHIIPMFKTSPLGSHGGGQADFAELEELAGKIRAAL